MGYDIIKTHKLSYYWLLPLLEKINLGYSCGVACNDNQAKVFHAFVKRKKVNECKTNV